MWPVFMKNSPTSCGVVDLALVPGLLRDEDGGGVVAEAAAEEVEAGERHHVEVGRDWTGSPCSTSADHLVGALAASRRRAGSPRAM